MMTIALATILGDRDQAVSSGETPAPLIAAGATSIADRWEVA